MVMHIKQLCKNMEMESTIRDITEKKLYSDTSAVEA